MLYLINIEIWNMFMYLIIVHLQYIIFTVKNYEDIEEVMRDKGLRLDDCYYMASKSPIDIKEL